MEIMLPDLSHCQYKTLMYWAKVGASCSERSKEYRIKFPNRKLPYKKILDIEKEKYGK